MSANDIITNIKTTIENNADWKNWVNGIWSRYPNSVECKSETEAYKLPAASALPESRVFSLPADPDYDVATAIRSRLNVSVITWIYAEPSRDLAADLRTVQEYIVKAIIADEQRGGNAWFTEITFLGDPVCDDDPSGYIRIDLQVYYSIKEAD